MSIAPAFAGSSLSSPPVSPPTSPVSPHKPPIRRRNPSRTRAPPERFDTLTFVKGSGAGGDQYERGYNRGIFCTTYQDIYQKYVDIEYKKDLEKAMSVETGTQQLPQVLTREILGLATNNSYYTKDIEFIAPDDIEPKKQIVDDDGDEYEWESGDETEEDEMEFELEDDE
jgi:hypothetical protein